MKNSDEKDEVKLFLLNDEISQLSAELRKFPYNPDYNRYLFSWDEIPGKDSRAFIEFIRENFSVNWVKTAKIDKLEEATTVKVSSENHSLTLELDNENTNAILTIDNVRTDEFIVKLENGKLNIYYKSYTQRYPENPTEFGNVIAEYELYSEKQYGMHMMVFWQHIWLILPKEIKDDLDLRSAKADFNVYVSFILL